MNQLNNRFILACAGAGKTTILVDEALKFNKRILLTTFTVENTNKIIEKIQEKTNGIVPPNIIVKPWYTFLLSDCIRPYQYYLGCNERICNMILSDTRENQKLKKDNIRMRYFIADSVIGERLSELSFLCNEKSNGKIFKRLKEVYSAIFIDEAQDLAGYDFELLHKIIDEGIQLHIVGDNRQKTYKTSRTNKNEKYNNDISIWFKDMEKKRKCVYQEINESRRSNQLICDLASKLYPEQSKILSISEEYSDFTGIFKIHSTNLKKYISLFFEQPMILVWDKDFKPKAMNYPSRNFGESKGTEYKNIVIIPTASIIKYLKKGDLSLLKDYTKNKLYVAITRAFHSVAFLIDEKIDNPLIKELTF